MHIYTLSYIAHAVVFVAVSLRVIMSRPAQGVALAWIFIAAFMPLVGVLLYLLFGERRVGHRRASRIADLRPDLQALGQEFIDDGFTDVDWSRHIPYSAEMSQLGQELVGFPTVVGNRLELFSNTLDILRAIAKDVDAAEHSVHMEFYIWHGGGEADAVVEAVLRAAKRGVTCRLLVDSIGGADWLKGPHPRRLREAGVEVRRAMPTGLLTALTSRNDLRLHRKIVLIDGQVAWTGSMNLVDPRFFKQESGVGEWIDAMARIEGSAVVPLAAILLADWHVETGAPIRELIESAHVHKAKPQGEADIQVIPSGPEEGDGILQMLVAMTYAARRRLILTTPYFIPDEALTSALRGAAARGVEVDLVVPDKGDSWLVHNASRSYYSELLEAGVRIQKFSGGLLHTKSITVDDDISMFGTVNLDMRSIWLNYEVSLFVYDAGFCRQLRALQESYFEASKPVEAAAWPSRPFLTRLRENTIRLVSPLL